MPGAPNIRIVVVRFAQVCAPSAVSHGRVRRRLLRTSSSRARSRDSPSPAHCVIRAGTTSGAPVNSAVVLRGAATVPSFRRPSARFGTDATVSRSRDDMPDVSDCRHLAPSAVGSFRELLVRAERAEPVAPVPVLQILESQRRRRDHGVPPRLQARGRVGGRTVELGVTLAQEPKRVVVGAEPEVQAVLLDPSERADGCSFPPPRRQPRW